MKSDHKIWGYSNLIPTFLIWASANVVGKIISDQVSFYTISGLRNCIAVIPMLFLCRKCLGMKIRKEDRKYFLLIGFLGYFLNTNLIQLGLIFTGAVTTSLICTMVPVFVTVFAVILLKEKFTCINFVCLIFAVSGAFVILSGAKAKGQIFGILMLLGSDTCWGLSSVLMRKLSSVYPAIVVTTYSLICALIFNIPLSAIGLVSDAGALTPDIIGAILYLGFICSGVAFMTWTNSLSVFTASYCSLFYPLQPFFSVILGVLFLQEELKIQYLIGMGLIFMDLLLARMTEISRETR